MNGEGVPVRRRNGASPVDVPLRRARETRGLRKERFDALPEVDKGARLVLVQGEQAVIAAACHFDVG